MSHISEPLDRLSPGNFRKSDISPKSLLKFLEQGGEDYHQVFSSYKIYSFSHT